MHASQKKRVVMIGFVLTILCLVFMGINGHALWQNSDFYDNNDSYTIETNLQQLDEVIIEGQRVFTLAAAGDDYVDETNYIYYGTVTNDPPTGMGEDSTTCTYLTEINYLLSGNYGFSGVFAFTDVDYVNYSSAIFHIEFATGSTTETLYCNFDSIGQIGTGINSDFSYDVSGYLSENIGVKLQDNDLYEGDADTWAIERMYITLSNAAATNLGPPTCSNLDDTDNLYAMSKYYQISTSHEDMDGYTDISDIDLICCNRAKTTYYWQMNYDEDIDAFSEVTDFTNGITIDPIGSTASKSGTIIDITWNIMINWSHIDISDFALRLDVNDNDGTNINYYNMTWDIITYLDLSSYDIADSSGDTGRGDIDDSMTASGIVTYFGTSIHPPADAVDVWISASQYGSEIGPWVATNYDDSGGTFSATVYADDAVGQDTYTFKVVAEDAGSSGANLLHTTHTDTYIADRIVVTSMYSDDSEDRVSVDDSVLVYCELEYEYDTEPVVNGTVQIEGSTATYQGSGTWSISQVRSSVTNVLYDEITYSGGIYGLRMVDQNSQSVTVIWDSVTISLSDPLDQRINRNDNATGIYISGVYDYDGQSFDGTITLNSSVFSYDSVGRRGYTVASLSGDSYGITAISTNDETYCIWDAIDIYNLESPEWVLVDEVFIISCQARLMYDWYVLDNMDDIAISGEWASWNGTHFLITKSYSSTGDHTFNITEGLDDAYGISVFGNSPETTTHVTDVPSITDIRSDFAPAGDLYTGVYTGASFWIHWDPLNDPIPPEVLFTLNGAGTLWWNVTSSYSGFLGGGGGGAGTAGGTIDTALPYSASNYTYTINVWNEAGYSASTVFYVFVYDYVVPAISTPSDVNFPEGVTGYSITWNGTDVHPYQYEITRNGTPIATGLWNSSLETITTPLDGLSYNNYVYVITLIDEYDHSVSDMVLVTVSDEIDPTISSPTDLVMTEGDLGRFIIWRGDDLHPASYDISRNGISIASGLWNFSSESLIVELDGLTAGEYTFIITLSDSTGNVVLDTVIVTVEAASVTTTTTTEPKTTTSSTTTTSTPGDGTILRITIVITVAGVVIVIVIVFLKKRA